MRLRLLVSAFLAAALVAPVAAQARAPRLKRHRASGGSMPSCALRADSTARPAQARGACATGVTKKNKPPYVYKVTFRNGSFLFGSIAATSRTHVTIQTTSGKMRIRRRYIRSIRRSGGTLPRLKLNKGRYLVRYRYGKHPRQWFLNAGLAGFAVPYGFSMGFALYALRESTGLPPAEVMWYLLPCAGPFISAGVIISKRSGAWPLLAAASLTVGIVQSLGMAFLVYALQKSRPKIPVWTPVVKTSPWRPRPPARKPGLPVTQLLFRSL